MVTSRVDEILYTDDATRTAVSRIRMTKLPTILLLKVRLLKENIVVLTVKLFI